MEELLEMVISHAKEISFTILFLFLFLYTLKTNSDRENRYIGTIDKLTEALKELDIVKTMIEKINDRLEIKK